MNFRFAEPALSEKSVRKLVDATGADPTGVVTTYFMGVIEDYLYAPNSPFRNEEL